MTPIPLADRYWPKVDVRGPDDCWPWLAKPTPNGYGQLWDRDARRPRLAHRIAYEFEHGSISDELVVDHTCHNATGCGGGPTCPHRMCQNPRHLEAITLQENKTRGQSTNSINKRKTHCKHGHEFTPANTIIRPLGRECRACHNTEQRDRARRNARRKGA